MRADGYVTEDQRGDVSSLSEGPMPDLEAALDGFNGDLGLFSEVSAVFVAEFPNMLASIRSAIDDPAALSSASHELRGAAANFHATELVEAAADLETMGRSGDLAGSSSAFQRLREAGARLLAALAAFAPEARPAHAVDLRR